MKLLHKAFALADVRDVEALCASVLAGHMRRTDAVLDPEDQADALAWLIDECWLLYEREYDPTRGVPFAAYATGILRLRVVEWYRRRFGRNGHRRPPHGICSLSELEPDQLEQAVHALAGDRESGGAADLARVLADRSRAALRAEAEIVRVAATPKGVARLLAELRDEIAAQHDEAA